MYFHHYDLFRINGNGYGAGATFIISFDALFFDTVERDSKFFNRIW